MLVFFFLINPPNLFSNIYVVIIWFYFFLTVVSISNGAATLAYQSWVVSWTTSSESQINLVTSREMFTLLGVIVASYFATQRMFFEMSIIVLLYSFFSVIALKTLSKNKLVKKKKNINVRFLSVFSKKTRRMFLIFGLNAFANSIPAILFIFFVQDILQLSNNKAGLLLIVYFIFAILSMPFWTRVINSFSPKSTWRFAISLSIFGFIWALFVGTDNFKYFLIICIFTGFALGAELICPPMILATKITQLGHNGALEGSYFGILNLFIKLSLALASGMILPILSYYGYTSSGNSSEFSLTLLQFFYAGFPCILKAFCWFEIRKI
ncbi:MAG: hypothetical protein CBD16_08690 [Betaproteobacteria bacterium TMED156]|nr:MAG: hypothetical protein CBD16_08690 [Betaproteobacteria bacterium TMED156]